MTHDSHYDLVSKLKPGRIILPVLIGLAVIGWFIPKDINTEVLSKLIFTWKSVFWLFIAWLCMVCRDIGYMIRIRILSDKDLIWRIISYYPYLIIGALLIPGWIEKYFVKPIAKKK